VFTLYKCDFVPTPSFIFVLVFLEMVEDVVEEEDAAVDAEDLVVEEEEEMEAVEGKTFNLWLHPNDEPTILY
jgi:hypothetical protein